MLTLYHVIFSAFKGIVEMGELFTPGVIAVLVITAVIWAYIGYRSRSHKDNEQ